jgi:hypothetical protein
MVLIACKDIPACESSKGFSRATKEEKDHSAIDHQVASNLQSALV